MAAAIGEQEQDAPETRPGFFTVVSGRRLPLAAALMAALAEHHPLARRHVIVTDAIPPGSTLEGEVIAADALDLPRLAWMRLWYTERELEAALKPAGFLHLMFAEGLDRVVYLDPATLLLAPLRPVLEALGAHSLMLVPSLLSPAAAATDDLAVLREGAYDGSLIAARRDRESVDFLRWWGGRCQTHCRDDPAAGMALDRRWLDLASGFVGRVRVLRHPGINVTPGNAAARDAAPDPAGVWRARGQALICCRFPEAAIEADAEFGPLALLFDRFRIQLRARGWTEARARPYGFDRFPDGRPVIRPMRRWLQRAIDEGCLPPSASPPPDGAFFDEADETLRGRGVALPRALYQLWLDDECLHRTFDIFTRAGLASFYDWATGEAGRAAGLDEATIAAAGLTARASLGGTPSPPWPALASRCWTDRASEVAAALAADLVVEREGEAIPVPAQAALAWELRRDLPPSFPLATLASLRGFLAWAMSRGITEGAVDPAALSPAFLAWWNAPAVGHETAPDVPVTQGMMVMHCLAEPKLRLEGWGQFPRTRVGRLAVGLAYARLAPALFGWPAAMVAPVVRYFAEPGPIAAEGYRFSRAAVALWELRKDLQRRFPLATEPGRTGLLRWLLMQGIADLGLDLAGFDPALAAWAQAPSAVAPSLPNLLAFILRERADLRRRFDPATPSGCAGLLEWAKQHFAREYAARALGSALAPPAPPLAPQSRRAALGLLGPWTAPTGMGALLRGLVGALSEVGFADFLIIDRDAAVLRDHSGAALPSGSRLSLDVLVSVHDADQAHAVWSFARSLGVAAACHFGLWHWALERLPAHLRHAFSFTDAILATSSFQQRAFAAEGLRPVSLVPMPLLDPPEVRPASRADFGLPEAGPLFLLAFACASIRRMNPEALIAAFRRAYPDPAEPATLLIATDGGAEHPHEMARLRALAIDPRIILRDETLGRAGMAGLIAAADAFVSLHRSVGFGRGIAEAMLRGIPVIATAWSGPADFLDASTGWPVDYRLVPIGLEEDFGTAGQHWAEPDIDHAAALLREVASNPEEARQRAARAQALIRRRYGAQPAAQGLLGAAGLRQMLDWQAPRDWAA